MLYQRARIRTRSRAERTEAGSAIRRLRSPPTHGQGVCLVLGKDRLDRDLIDSGSRTECASGEVRVSCIITRPALILGGRETMQLDYYSEAH